MALGPYRGSAPPCDDRDEALEKDVAAFGANVRTARRRDLVRAVALRVSLVSALAVLVVVEMWLAFDVSAALAVALGIGGSAGIGAACGRTLAKRYFRSEC